MAVPRSLARYQPELNIIPYTEFEMLQRPIKALADICDREANLKTIQGNKEDVIRGEITYAILYGTNPIRVWREYKKIKLNEMYGLVLRICSR